MASLEFPCLIMFNHDYSFILLMFKTFPYILWLIVLGAYVTLVVMNVSISLSIHVSCDFSLAPFPSFCLLVYFAFFTLFAFGLSYFIIILYIPACFLRRDRKGMGSDVVEDLEDLWG